MNTSQLKIFLTKKNIGLFVVGLLVLTAVLVSLGSKPKEEASTSGPLAQKPETCLSLSGTGKQIYDIRTDNPMGLKIVQVDVDPIDVKEGQTQTITVKVKDDDNNTITKKSGVTANIRTDNKNTAVAAFALRLAEDSEDGLSLLTIWEGSWTRDDDYCMTYIETITATNDKGEEHSVDLSFK